MKNFQARRIPPFAQGDTEAELQRRSCSVPYPGLVALTHAALIGHGYRVHQPSEFRCVVEIGRGSCTLANVPAKCAVEFCDISRRPLKGFWRDRGWLFA